MDAENNISVASCSPSQPRRLSANREKGWSLSRNKKIMIKRNFNQTDVLGSKGKRKDKEDNDTVPDFGDTNISHELLGKDQKAKEPVNEDKEELGTSDDLNGNLSLQKALECNISRSPAPRKTVSGISRSVSFAYRSKENMRDLWEQQEPCPSLYSAGKEYVPRDSSRPHSSLDNRSSNILVPGDIDRFSESKVPVILRDKTGLRQSSETFSSAERIKRRSAEISQLRLTLEEKVKAYQYRSSYTNSTYRNSWSDLPRSPQFFKSRSRPKSACGISHMEDYFENEREFASPLEQRNNKRNMSSERYGAPSLHSITSKTQKVFSPNNVQKDSAPYLCQKCSSPVRIRSQESLWSLCRKGEDTPSRYHTPSASPAHRMPQLNSYQGNPKPKSSENMPPSKYSI